MIYSLSSFFRAFVLNPFSLSFPPRDQLMIKFANHTTFAMHDKPHRAPEPGSAPLQFIDSIGMPASDLAENPIHDLVVLLQIVELPDINASG
jgi:hypothetical protein